MTSLLDPNHRRNVQLLLMSDQYPLYENCTWWVSLWVNSGRESATKWNSSGVMLWQQLAAIAKAFLWALMLKNSRYRRQSASPPYKGWQVRIITTKCGLQRKDKLMAQQKDSVSLTACKMALLCRLDNISKAVRACSATSMNWITWSCRQESQTIH